MTDRITRALVTFTGALGRIFLITGLTALLGAAVVAAAPEPAPVTVS